MNRRALAAVAACAVAVAGGCGARVSPAEIAGSSSPGTTVAGAAASTASGNSSSGTTTSSPTAAHQAGGTTTTGAQAGAAGTPALTPTQPGTYSYAQSGTTTVNSSTSPVPSRGTVVYDAPSGTTGNWAQVAHSFVNPSQPPTDTTYAITSSGIAITQQIQRMAVGSSTVTFTCNFSPPMQITSWPVRVGYSFTGSASCTGSSSFTVQVSGHITGTKTVTLDGAPLTTYVVDTTITTTGSVTSTDSEEDWFAPSLRIDVHQNTNENGNFGGFAKFAAQVTRDLVSGHPA